MFNEEADKIPATVKMLSMIFQQNMIFGLEDQGRSFSKAQNKTRTNIFFIYNRSENGIPLNKYSSTTGN